MEPKPPLEPWQVAELLGIMRSPRETRLLMYGVFAGTRISESTTIDGPEWGEHSLIFRGSKPPYKYREVPLHPELSRHRDLILSEQELNPQGLKHVARNLRDRVDFDWTPHALRRTFVQTLLDREVPLEVVEGLVGHSPRSMTLKAYGSIPLEQKAAAVAKIPYRVRASIPNQLHLF